jgi:ADP-ribosylglycohydrolase
MRIRKGILMQDNKISGAIFGALVGDAFSLGGHWEYNTEAIKQQFPDLNGFEDPMTKYHGDKKAGDFTHYGDQTFWLWQSIQKEGNYSIEAYMQMWQEKMQSYNGYVDGASKATLANLASGSATLNTGSDSQDFSPIGRIAVLLSLDLDEKSFREKSVEVVKATHNAPMLLEAVDLMAMFVYRVAGGESIESVFNSFDQNNSLFGSVKQSLNEESTQVISSFGASCGVKGCLPSVLHLILKYQDDFETAMRANVYAGGDSAARGMVVGMILGAALGEQKVSWRDQLINMPASK